MCTGSFTWIILSLLIVYGVSDFTCPKVAELGSPVQLNCTYSNPPVVSYTSPGISGTIATCKSDECLNFTEGYYPTFISVNKSKMEIRKVQLKDGGEWICQAGSIKLPCTLVLTQTPTCNITSGNDTNYLDIHENILLLVNVIDYYCSSTIDFLLRAGNIETDLLKNHTMSEKTITSDVFDSTFNVNESHIGCVELIFICHNVRKAVQCGGVQSLKKRPPMCKITDDRDAGGWEVGDEITLSVSIEDYFCSGDLEFFLHTGGETNRLNVTGIYNGTITFTAKKSNIPVYLEMKCKNVSRNLTCDGIKELSKSRHIITSTLPPENDCDDKIAVISGVVSFVAITIAVIILIWYFKYQRNKPSGHQRATSQQDIEFEDIGGYTEVRDFNRNPDVHCQKKPESKTNSQMTRDPGFAAAEEPEKEKELTNCTGLSEQEAMPRPKDSDIYTKVNKATSGSSDNGGIA